VWNYGFFMNNAETKVDGIEVLLVKRKKRKGKGLNDRETRLQQRHKCRKATACVPDTRPYPFSGLVGIVILVRYTSIPGFSWSVIFPSINIWFRMASISCLFVSHVVLRIPGIPHRCLALCVHFPSPSRGAIPPW